MSAILRYLSVCSLISWCTLTSLAGDPPPALRGEYHREYPAAASVSAKAATPRAGVGDWQVQTLPLGPLSGNLLGPAEVAIDSARHRLYVSARFSDSIAVVDTHINCVVAKIPVGLRPVGVALDLPEQLLFVACNLSDRVDIIDVATYEWMGYIPVGQAPQGLAYDPARFKLYVGNTADDTVTVVDLLSAAPPTVVPVGDYPFSVRYSPGLDRVYVTNTSGNSLTVIDPETDAVVNTSPTGMTPVDIAFDEAHGLVYVTNYTDGNVTTHNAAGVKQNVKVTVGPGAWGIDYDPLRQWLFVGVQNSHRLHVFDTTDNHEVRSMPASVEPQGLRLDPLARVVYNAIGGSDSIIAYDIDADDQQWILTGQDPTDVAVDSQRNTLYASIYGSNDFLAVDGADLSLIYRAPSTGLSPHGLALDEARNRLAVVNWNSNQVTFHRAGDGWLTAAQDTPNGPWDLAWDEPGDRLYISGRLSGLIGLYAGTTPLNPLATHRPTTGLALHPTQNLLYACLTALQPGDTGQMVAYNVPGSATAFSVPAGLDPIGVAVDAMRNRVYWANSDIDTLAYADALTGAATGAISVAAAPADVVVDATGRRVFVSNFLADRVSVVNTASGTPELQNEVPVGTSPWRMAYNPTTHTAYVGNRNSGTLSILSHPADPGRTPPAAPAGLAVDSLGKRVTLSWDAVDDPEVEGLDVYRSEVSETDFVRINPRRLEKTAVQFSDPNVVYGLPYTYAVVARDRYGVATPLVGAPRVTVVPQESTAAGFRVIIDDVVRVAAMGETVEYVAILEAYGGWNQPVHLACYVENGNADVEILPGPDVIPTSTGTPVTLRVRVGQATPNGAYGGVLRGEAPGLDHRAAFAVVVRPPDRPDLRVLTLNVGRTHVGAFEKQIVTGRIEPPIPDGRRYHVLVTFQNDAHAVDPASSEGILKQFLPLTDRLGFFQQDIDETRFGFYRVRAYMAANETSYVAQSMHQFYSIERGISRLFLGTDAPQSATGVLDPSRALTLEGRVIGRAPGRSSVQLEVVSPSGNSVKIPSLFTNDRGQFGVSLPFANPALPIPPIDLNEHGWYRVVGANIGSYYFVASQSDPMLLPVGDVSGADWKALLVTGLSSVSDDPRNAAARAMSDAMYGMLADRRLDAGDVFWLGDTGDGRVDGAATMMNVANALVDINGGAGPADPVLLYLCGHALPGADPALLLQGAPASGERIHRSQLGNLLGSLAATRPLVVVLDFSDAGSWIAALSGPNRALLAACGAGQDDFVAASGRLSFTSLLSTALRGSAPLGKAFAETRDRILGLPALFPGQSPAAAIPTAMADWSLAYPAGLPSVPPAFGAGQFSQLYYCGEGASLLAQVTDADGPADVGAVEALVIPADSQVDYGPAESAGLHSPEMAGLVVPLVAEPGGNLFRREGMVLARNQPYTVVFAARDAAGNVTVFEPERPSSDVHVFKTRGLVARAAETDAGQPRYAIRLSAVPAPDAVAADVDRDGLLGSGDVWALALAWGEAAPSVVLVDEEELPQLAVRADLNHDGMVDAADLLVLTAGMNGQ